MRIPVLLAALGFASPVFAATVTPPKPPARPTPPTVSLKDTQKATPQPAKDPVLFDSIRRLLGPEKSAPKSGAGPGIG